MSVFYSRCASTFVTYTAVEFMDGMCMEVVVEELALHNPLSPHPFYVLVETSGSHDQHDKEVSKGQCPIV